MREAKFRILVFPFAVAIGSIIGGLFGELILRIDLFASMEVCAGYGWYTLAAPLAGAAFWAGVGCPRFCGKPSQRTRHSSRCVARKHISSHGIKSVISYPSNQKPAEAEFLRVDKRFKAHGPEGLARISQVIIQVSALMNPISFKLYQQIVLMGMESAGAMKNLLEQFKNCPRVVQIFKTRGGYNLIALVIAEDRDTLESISIEKCSLRSSAGIRGSEFYPIGDIYFTPFLRHKALDGGSPQYGHDKNDYEYVCNPPTLPQGCHNNLQSR